VRRRWFGPASGLAREVSGLGLELARIAAGRSQVEPRPRDRRFADPAWRENPLYHRIGQSYVAAADVLQKVVEEYARTTQRHGRAERARFAAEVLRSAAAPTNFLATNPAAIKRAFDTGGLSLVRGARNLVSDLRRNGGMPSMVPPGAFEVGRNLAVTPGAVVARDDVAELLQYRPSTSQVRDRPLLVVPPPIGRYYFLDLAPGRSFVEYAVGGGLQTFMLS
jgi:polyhydroxyalkanoate synthase subunit PhaC